MTGYGLAAIGLVVHLATNQIIRCIKTGRERQ
jgi:hypothetical protein